MAVSGDRARRAVVGLVGAALPNVDYWKDYPSTVEAQNGDGTLELRPDAADVLDPVSKVPLHLGVPGIGTLQVKKGARVLLGFLEGNPSRPVAKLWEGHSLVKLVLVADDAVEVEADTVKLTAASEVEVDTGTAKVSADEVLLSAPTVKVGANATQAMLRGTLYRTAESTLHTAMGTFLVELDAYVVAIKPIADPTNAATPAIVSAITAMGTALTAFEGQALNYLSGVGTVE